MDVALDRVKLFDQFLASADLRMSFGQDGERFSGPKTHLQRGFDKVIEPLQDLLEDAVQARQILLSFGYGDDSMPLSLLVSDLIARVVESADSMRSDVTIGLLGEPEPEGTENQYDWPETKPPLDSRSALQ